jgi:fimbrial isopeptide formation D2 family protein/LPXTG-motif cell wall-anchored protein
MTGYDKYFFVIEDTLSSGLTYNTGSLSISVEGLSGSLRADADTDYTNYASDNADYYVTTATDNETGATNINVVFENFLANMKAKGVSAGDDITITYTATLNSNAVITNAGNPNSAKLVYSNDPNSTAQGKDSSHPDEPKEESGNVPGDVVGETPDSTVKTYTTAIRIKKVDENNAALTGAKFTLTSSDMKDVKVVSLTEFVEDSEGQYYLLNNGTYTKTAPDGNNDALYRSTSIKYKKQTASSQSTVIEDASGTDYAIEAQVDSNGYITFYGLKAGSYTVTETLVPEGYNGASPVTITIGNSAAPTSSAPNWSVQNATLDTDGTYDVTIQNRQGVTLPSTGGIGTKLFYIFGSILVAGSVIFLVTKKRMSAKEN